MNKEQALKLAEVTLERAMAMIDTDREGAAALLRGHGMSDDCIADVLTGATVETIQCELCEASVPVTGAHSVDDFWVCNKCT